MQTKKGRKKVKKKKYKMEKDRPKGRVVSRLHPPLTAYLGTSPRRDQGRPSAELFPSTYTTLPYPTLSYERPPLRYATLRLPMLHLSGEVVAAFLAGHRAVRDGRLSEVSIGGGYVMRRCGIFFTRVLVFLPFRKRPWCGCE